MKLIIKHVYLLKHFLVYDIKSLLGSESVTKEDFDVLFTWDTGQCYIKLPMILCSNKIVASDTHALFIFDSDAARRMYDKGTPINDEIQVALTCLKPITYAIQ